MRVDRPAPGERLNTGEVVTPRPAASMVLLRDGQGGPEVLLVQRNPQARFMGGLWVFPGGASGPEDGEPLRTALRELEEEAGIRLEDPDAPAFARWITPEQLAMRFDAWFFVAAAPPEAEPRVDGSECVDVRWLRPADALAACEQEQLSLAFPTYKQLEELARFSSVEEALESARNRTVTAITPRLVVDEQTVEVRVDGER